MAMMHADLESGRWGTLTLLEQLGNIGSEVGRAGRWKNKDPARAGGAADRALELIDLTLQDPRWRGRRKEIARAREIFCECFFGKSSHHTTLADLERYFHTYALAARSSR